MNNLERRNKLLELVSEIAGRTATDEDVLKLKTGLASEIGINPVSINYEDILYLYNQEQNPNLVKKKAKVFDFLGQIQHPLAKGEHIMHVGKSKNR